MAFARVVSFEGVDGDRVAQVASEVENDPQPDDIPATEILMLHDPGAKRALVIMFFETEDDYRRGDATLDAMEPGDTPGQRASVDRFEVAFRRTA
jgi:hypothetical protein